VVAQVVVDEVLPGVHGGLEPFQRRSRGAPQEEVGKRHFDAVALMQASHETGHRVVDLDARVVLLCRRVQRRHLAVEGQFAFRARRGDAGTQAVRPRDVHRGLGRVLQLLAVGQHALAGDPSGDGEALQRLQVRPHVLQRLDRFGGNGVDRRRGGCGRRGLLRPSGRRDKSPEQQRAQSGSVPVPIHAVPS